MTTSKPYSDIPLSRIAIRFAQMAYLFPSHADDRLWLAEEWGNRQYDDEKLAGVCLGCHAGWLGQMEFRQTVMTLLEDIAFRGVTPEIYEDIIYSLIRETGCTPEQAREVLNHA